MGSYSGVPAWSLPEWKETIVLNETEEDLDAVAFYPFGRPGAPPVFAVAGRTADEPGSRDLVMIFQRGSSGFKPVLVLRDSEPEAPASDIESDDPSEEPELENRRLVKLAWAQDVNGTPLLCFAGQGRIIKVINAQNGKLFRVLTGHGQPINDLKVHPLHPHIIASASDDYSIIIWDLEATRSNRQQLAVIAGFGHIDAVLSLAFHKSGDWIVSGGFDNRVNVWRFPDIPEGNKRSTVKLHEPHFTTTCLHSSPVTCVAFQDDLILSHSHGSSSVKLWSIPGFDPSSAICVNLPSRICHPAERPGTRSAFLTLAKWIDPRDAHTVLLDRLASFKIPGEWAPDVHNERPPFVDFGMAEQGNKLLLAVCQGMKMAFWDLGRCYQWMSLVREGEDLRSIPWLKASRRKLSPDPRMTGTAQSLSAPTGTSVTRPSPLRREISNGPLQGSSPLSMPPPSSVPSTPAHRPAFKNMILSKEEADTRFRSGSSVTSTPRTPGMSSSRIPTSSTAASPLTTAEKRALPEFLKTEDGGKFMRQMAEEIVDDHLDSQPLDLNSLRKNLPGAEMYDACDPLQDLKPHKLLEGQSTGEINRRVAWSMDGKVCVAVGDHGVINVYGK